MAFERVHRGGEHFSPWINSVDVERRGRSLNVRGGPPETRGEMLQRHEEGSDVFPPVLIPTAPWPNR